MRIFLSLLLLAGVSRIASAHTLGSEDGVLVQLWHQLLGLHRDHFVTTLALSWLVPEQCRFHRQ
jgi:hypothetical protein